MSADSKPYLSLIIPAYNEESLIAGTLAGLHRALEELDERYEVIVVDDDSSDGTAALAATLGARVIHVNKRHIAATRNAGAVAAEGDCFFFVDADTRVTAAVIAAAAATRA